MIAVVTKMYLMKHCDTINTSTENLGRGGRETGESKPLTSHALYSQLQLCKVAIIKIIVALFSSISPASHPFRIITSHPFLSLPLTLQATYSPGLSPPCVPPQDWISDDICSIFWKLDQTFPIHSFVYCICQTKNRVQFWFFRSLTYTFDSKTLYPIVFRDANETSLFSQSGSCFHSFASVSWCIH